MGAATAEVASAIDHLQSGDALAVTFLGGLGPAYADRLTNRWPVRAALGTALDGALILAREGA